MKIENGEVNKIAKSGFMKPAIVPDDETIEAIEAARRGEPTSVSSADQLFVRLNQQDGDERDL
jgi:hypothetical protein